ncbi:MAG: hypothetical protein ACOCYC_02010 [bacterium]
MVLEPGAFAKVYGRNRRRWWFIAAGVAILLGVNMLLKNLNAVLMIPFFFDTIGTAVAAALFGLLPGLLVGVATNGVQELMAGTTMESLPWAICSAATAVIVWAHVRAGRFRTLRDAALVTVWVALANSALGAVIATYLYGGVTGVPIDYIVVGFVTSGRSVLFSTFVARVPSNLVDKGIAVFLAYLAWRQVAGDRPRHGFSREAGSDDAGAQRAGRGAGGAVMPPKEASGGAVE